MRKRPFLERSTLIAAGAHVLEGLWHDGSAPPPCLVVPPEPALGGGMDHVIAAELAWALSQADHATLRFNVRGVGASQGTRSDLAACVDDAAAALALLRENASGAPPAVFALPGAERVALSLAARAELAGLGLVHPARASVEALERAGAPLWVLVASESVFPSVVADAVDRVGGRRVVVPAADAQFRKNLSEVGREAAKWLKAFAASDPKTSPMR